MRATRNSSLIDLIALQYGPRLVRLLVIQGGVDQTGAQNREDPSKKMHYGDISIQ